MLDPRISSTGQRNNGRSEITFTVPNILLSPPRTVSRTVPIPFATGVKFSSLGLSASKRYCAIPDKGRKQPPGPRGILLSSPRNSCVRACRKPIRLRIKAQATEAETDACREPR